MKFFVVITLSVMFFLPSYVFSQDQVSPNTPERPQLKTQVILKEGTSTPPLIVETAPEKVITTRSKPIPGPVMQSTALPKSTLEEQILKYESQLASLSGKYREANPDVVKNLEMIIQRKKKEKLLRDEAQDNRLSN